MHRRDRQEQLLERYVACFATLDDMTVMDDFASPALELSTGAVDQYDFKIWAPRRVETNPALLEPVYQELPARFPPLYERMVLSYRWAEVDLDSYRLVANPPGPDLSGLLRCIFSDPGLSEALIPQGFIQFGKGPDIDYDPVCFETKTQRRNGDYRIVKIDHEEILCNHRVKIVAELAGSFEELVLKTIEQAESRPI